MSSSISSGNSKATKTAIENEISEFLAKSPDEQRKYERGLADNLKVLDELYEKVTKLAPDKVQEFKNTTRGKIEFVQKILKEREANKKTYQDLIEGNAELFSKESKDEWIKEFENLSGDAEQKRYIAEFQKQIDAKKSVMKTFKAFPEAIQKKFEAQFAKARRPERTVVLQDMERALEEEVLNVLNSDPNAKHFSEIERASAMKTFKSKKIEERTEMFGLIRGMLKYNAGMSKKYEDLEPEIKLEVQERMGFTNYYQLSFEDKTKAIETGEKMKEPNARVENLYEDKLNKAVERKYMSRPSADKFKQPGTVPAQTGDGRLPKGCPGKTRGRTGKTGSADERILRTRTHGAVPKARRHSGRESKECAKRKGKKGRRNLNRT